MLGWAGWWVEDVVGWREREGVGVPSVVFGQCCWDGAAAQAECERMLLDGCENHAGNPVMTWCAANAVTVSDPAGNRKLSKERATGLIDGMVAAVMAVGASLQGEEKTCNDLFVSL